MPQVVLCDGADYYYYLANESIIETKFFINYWYFCTNINGVEISLMDVEITLYFFSYDKLTYCMYTQARSNS